MSNSGRGLPSSAVVCSTRRSDRFAPPPRGTSSGLRGQRDVADLVQVGDEHLEVALSPALIGSREALLDGVRAADLGAPGDRLLPLAGPSIVSVIWPLITVAEVRISWSLARVRVSSR